MQKRSLSGEDEGGDASALKRSRVEASTALVTTNTTSSALTKSNKVASVTLEP